MKKLLVLLSVFLTGYVAAETKCLIIKKDGVIIKQENNCEERHSPCSTFKIAISLMGFDSGILKNENTPEWSYDESYGPAMESWKKPQTPKTWIENSCVWYSQKITKELGFEKFRQYVESFNYGNKDVFGDKNQNNGLTRSWLMSSLTISPIEQINFIEDLIKNKLPVSKEAMQYARDILYVSDLKNGWKLYGKTGSSGRKLDGFQSGWFVGWAIQEKTNSIITFALYLEEQVKEGTLPGGPHAKEIVIQEFMKSL